MKSPVCLLSRSIFHLPAKPWKYPGITNLRVEPTGQIPSSTPSSSEDNTDTWSSAIGTEELNINTATGFQKPTSIQWNATADITDNPNEFIININATIDDGWNIYSMFMDEGGPIPTTLIWENEGRVHTC